MSNTSSPTEYTPYGPYYRAGGFALSREIVVDWLMKTPGWQQWSLDDESELLDFTKSMLPKDLRVKVSPADGPTGELQILCVSYIVPEPGRTIPKGESIEDAKYMPPLKMRDAESRDVKLQMWLRDTLGLSEKSECLKFVTRYVPGGQWDDFHWP